MSHFPNVHEVLIKVTCLGFYKAEAFSKVYILAPMVDLFSCWPIIYTQNSNFNSYEYYLLFLMLLYTFEWLYVAGWF